MVEGIEQLWDSGMVVVAAAGNSGPKPGSVTAPGVSRKVITVGAFDEVRFRSGRGPTKECVVKPEVLVRGTNIVSCSNIQGRYAMKSGTSMAAPIVSGAVAKLLQKNPTLTPGAVKLKIHDSAVMQEKYRSLCAWGVLDVGKLLKS
jgi:serine protease AprX